MAHLRFGMILAARGGALGAMLPAFRLGLGGPVGLGRQVLSWIALDDALGDCLKGARGMLHVTPRLLAQQVAAFAVQKAGNLWVTPMGNIVVADAGYPGTAPSGQETSAGNEWAFATGMVDIRLGEVFVTAPADGFHHRSNTNELRASRLAAVAVDPCCLLAIQVNPCASPCD